MKNGILLNALYSEWYAEQCEKTMHIDDIKAIERVKELLVRELPIGKGGAQDD